MMIPPHWQLIGSKFCIAPPSHLYFFGEPLLPRKKTSLSPPGVSACSLVEFLMYRQKERYSLRLKVKLKIFDFHSI